MPIYEPAPNIIKTIKAGRIVSEGTKEFSSLPKWVRDELAAARIGWVASQDRPEDLSLFLLHRGTKVFCAPEDTVLLSNEGVVYRQPPERAADASSSSV